MKLIAIFIAGLFASASGAATPVDLKFKISGPDGPLQSFYLSAAYRESEKMTKPIFAKTNELGEVVFHLDRSICSDIEITMGDPTLLVESATDQDIAASQAFAALRAHLGLPSRWVVRLPENTSVVERAFAVPAARTVKLAISQEMADPHNWVSLGVPGYLGSFPRVNTATRVLSCPGIPINREFTAYLTFNESTSHMRSVPVHISAGSTDLEIPELAIAPLNCTANIRVEEAVDSRRAPIEMLQGFGAPGTTLVSSDGDVIVSVVPIGDAPAKIPVPAGTYYYLPGGIGPDDFQVKLIEKLKGGADLSTVFPHVTVVAGETKTLKVNAIDTINAIYALP